ncbi:putative RNA-directed DNA polymerase [Helianthus annuus]|nr:putative RNA-directed DNA polymerase [Helianthus annuus]
MILTSTISEAAFQHVQGQTSREVWLSLERAYAPNTSSREYTLKTQLLRIMMKGDEKPTEYLTRAQEYASALANIGEPMKDKDLVMLVISGLREEYHGLKSNLLTRQPPVAFNELHGLLHDHDYMLSVHRSPSNTAAPPQAFAASTEINQPNLNAVQSQLSNLQLLANQLGYQLNPLSSSTPQPQANYTTRSFSGSNSNRGQRRGNFRGNSRGASNRNRDSRDTGPSTKFSWASTQQMVYGHCNRCGIGHIPSQCPNQPASSSSRQPTQANFANFSDVGSQYDMWKPDTGCNQTATPDLSSLDHSECYHGNDSLHVGDGNPLPIFHIGSSKFYSPNKTFNLSNILHVPNLKQNLLSVQQFCLENNVFFEFHSSFFVVKDESTHTTLLTGPSENGLYTLRLPRFKSIPKLAFTSIKAPSTVWHQRLGHPHQRVFDTVISSFSLPVTTKRCSSLCTACQLGKSSKLCLPLSNFRSHNVLDLVYCDVWGPSPTLSNDGYQFFLLCVDHHSRFMWYFPLTKKSDVYTTFKNFLTMVERQFNTKLKSVQTDWGGEFRNLSPFFTSLGIIHRRSCPYTSAQNGIVERRNRHVVETGLTLLAQANLPQRFWHYAFETAVYLINRLPSRTSSNKSPYQQLHNRKPDYTFLRVFGCQCFPYLRSYNHHKMDFRSTPCVFLGYSPSHHGYRCFDLATERIYIARYVRFNEHVFPYNPPQPSPTPTIPTPVSIFPDPPPCFTDEQSAPQSPPSTTQNHSNSNPPSSEPASAQSASAQAEPASAQADSAPPASAQPASAPSVSTQPQTGPSSNFPTPPPRPRPSNLRQNPKQTQFYTPSAYSATTSSNPTVPTTFTAANTSPEWRHAMNQEYQALLKNGTWSLVPYDNHSNLIDCKWVYRLKSDAQGKLTRYKARLVAKGFHQKPGVDYHETFSPVIKPTTIRVILSLAVTQQWPLRQLDVENAFLHGDISETIYMKQPPGFADPSKPNHVCLLHRSLYGLKQAPRAWFHRLSTVLQQLGFRGSKTDPSLFILKHGATLVYILVYVDDIIITGNNNSAISGIIKQLNASFAIKDLGQLHYFLGIEVLHHQKNVLLSQRKYILDILQRAGLSDCKPVNSPMSTSQVLTLDDSPLLSDPTKYRQIVGALQYSTLSRPDIAFAVNKVCQFMHAPTENHWSAVKRILRYLKGTSDLGLLIRHNSSSLLHAFTDAHWQDTVINAFSDSDWAGCPVDRRSTGGFAVYLGSNLISWTARKQRTVSRSSTESEYKALADTVAELLWLKALLHELGTSSKISPTLWCDNLGATYLSANPVFHARTKHVEVDYHFVREQVTQGQLNVKFISTNDQIADVFTKPLSSQRFIFLRSKLQVAPRP